jgi:hypothetical protein
MASGSFISDVSLKSFVAIFDAHRSFTSPPPSARPFASALPGSASVPSPDSPPGNP